MKKRNIRSVLFLSFVTFFVYGLVWLAKTRDEMEKMGARIPKTVLLFIPFINLYWLWKYSEGVCYVTKGRITVVSSFLLTTFVGVVGCAIIQREFNELSLSIAKDATRLEDIKAVALDENEPTTQAETVIDTTDKSTEFKIPNLQTSNPIKPTVFIQPRVDVMIPRHQARSITNSTKLVRLKMP